MDASRWHGDLETRWPLKDACLFLISLFANSKIKKFNILKYKICKNPLVGLS